jgi:hypothetical protein
MGIKRRRNGGTLTYSCSFMGTKEEGTEEHLHTAVPSWEQKKKERRNTYIQPFLHGNKRRRNGGTLTYDRSFMGTGTEEHFHFWTEKWLMGK